MILSFGQIEIREPDKVLIDLLLRVLYECPWKVQLAQYKNMSKKKPQKSKLANILDNNILSYIKKIFADSLRGGEHIIMTQTYSIFIRK